MTATMDVVQIALADRTTVSGIVRANGYLLRVRIDIIPLEGKQSGESTRYE